MAVRKRPNPAVESAERAARSSEVMAGMTPEIGLGARIAARKRRTADKIRKERPFLIESE
jgi:hypothetical protein